MKRLTKKIDNGRFVTTDAEARSYGETDPEDGFFYNYFTGEAVDKLAAYEDTGLEPADIEALLAKGKNVPDKNVGKWISVEERLPEKKVGDAGYVGYLVLSDGEYQIADYTHDKYMQTAYEFHIDGEYDPNITHWTELPPEEVQMADILIRMEMPKTCADCHDAGLPTVIAWLGAKCPWANGIIDPGVYDLRHNRHPDCPLHELPEHGDLVEADKLREIAYERAKQYGCVAFVDALDITLAPVVVPSNKEETK